MTLAPGPPPGSASLTPGSAAIRAAHTPGMLVGAVWSQLDGVWGRVGYATSATAPSAIRPSPDPTSHARQLTSTSSNPADDIIHPQYTDAAMRRAASVVAAALLLQQLWVTTAFFAPSSSSSSSAASVTPRWLGAGAQQQQQQNCVCRVRALCCVGVCVSLSVALPMGC